MEKMREAVVIGAFPKFKNHFLTLGRDILHLLYTLQLCSWNQKRRSSPSEWVLLHRFNFVLLDHPLDRIARNAESLSKLSNRYSVFHSGILRPYRNFRKGTHVLLFTPLIGQREPFTQQLHIQPARVLEDLRTVRLPRLKEDVREPSPIFFLS